MPTTVRRGQSVAPDARLAVQEFHAQVQQPDAGLVLFFCSSAHDLDALAAEMNRLFVGVQVVGCTSAGEMGPLGCQDGSLSGASFSGDGCVAVSGRIGFLQHFEMGQGQALAQGLMQRMESLAPDADADNCVALLLIDGMSKREEPVTRSLQNALGRWPLAGGSAGDGLDFGHTQVFCDGAFHVDSAVLVLLKPNAPFKLFKTQHFVATDERLVVTDADAANRIVREINGLPAAEEYARILGLAVGDLDPGRFAAWPVVVMIDGTNYVRSIQKANADGSLTFFCAIEDGLVLRVAKGVDLQTNLAEVLAQVQADVGPLQLLLVFDCILRKLEIAQCGLTPAVAQTLQACQAVGFNTYGEQFNGVHVNQTLVGLAIGSAGAAEVPEGADHG